MHSRVTPCRLVVCICGFIAMLNGRDCGALDFTEIARFNLDSTADPMNPEYIGSNPSALAWSGSRLFVAGFNNGGTIQDTAIVEVTNATALGSVDGTYSVPLQTIQTRAMRGYISLDVSSDGGSLAVAYDDGMPFAEGFQVYDLGTNTQRWNFEARGSSGAAFDPGSGGMDSGTAFGQFGSGRRLLNDTTTGSVLYDSTDGFVWYGGSPGTFVRDIDFDPDNGDMYVRHNNQLSRATRTGGNSATADGVIVALTDAPFVSHQNLGFLNGTSQGDVIIFNDRPDTAADKEFLTTMQVVDRDGTPVASTFSFLGGATPATSAGWYDFDFDPVSQTLAISDNSNRNVHIFQIGGMTTPDCDLDGDGDCDIDDIDDLVMALANNSSDPKYDLNGDTIVDLADRDEWLALAGAENLGSGEAYLVGDADLDGNVNGADFLIWNANKFTFPTQTAKWSLGDFDANGFTDGGDFLLWNTNKFMSVGPRPVPEPAMFGLTLLPVLGGVLLVRRKTKPCC